MTFGEVANPVSDVFSLVTPAGRSGGGAQALGGVH